MGKTVSISTVSEWAVSSVSMSQKGCMSESVAVCSVSITTIRIGCHVSAQQMCSVTGVSVSQGVGISGGSDDCLLHFGNVSNWSSSDMTMSQTMSKRTICTQMSSIAMAVSQAVRSDCSIVRGNRCHVLRQGGVGRDDGDGVMPIPMSICLVSQGRVSSMSEGTIGTVTVSQGTQTGVSQREAMAVGTVQTFRGCERGDDKQDGDRLDHDDSCRTIRSLYTGCWSGRTTYLDLVSSDQAMSGSEFVMQ